MFSFSSLAAIFDDLAGTFQPALPAVEQTFGADSSAVAKVQAGIATARSAADALATPGAGASPPDVQALTNDVGAALNVLAQVPLSPNVAAGVRIAQMVVPVAGAAIGVFASKASAKAAG